MCCKLLESDSFKEKIYKKYLECKKTDMKLENQKVLDPIRKDEPTDYDRDPFDAVEAYLKSRLEDIYENAPGHIVK
jgi:hypothetical protein